MNKHSQMATFATAAALKGEAALPTNCFSMNGNAVLEEGFYVSRNHPLTGGRSALIVGEHYVLVDNRDGCVVDSAGTARHANVKWSQVGASIRKFLFLTKTNGNVSRMLLHVDSSMPKGMRSKMHFWSGIVATTEVLATSQNESLLSFNKKDETCEVFYEDGRVVRVV
ncbi:MAG: hypothetical protein WA014_01255, partial [Minisyncoccia bacterium]